MIAFHPACCSALSSHNPLPQPPAGSVLISSCFNPAQLAPDDFSRCNIEPEAGSAKRQTEYLAGRLCARAALHQLNGINYVPPKGADRAPQWPAGFVGSITHGDGWAAAIAAPQTQWQSLGIDIERLLSVERATRLQGQLLTPAECAHLAGLTPEQHAHCISVSFSLKESLFKALYPLTGTRFYFHDAQIIEWTEHGARLQLLKTLSPHWPAGTELTGQFCQFDQRVLSVLAISA